MKLEWRPVALGGYGSPTIDTSLTYPSECPAQYVVETNAGWTRKHGVKAGQKVTLPPL